MQKTLLKIPHYVRNDYISPHPLRTFLNNRGLFRIEGSEMRNLKI